MEDNLNPRSVFSENRIFSLRDKNGSLTNDYVRQVNNALQSGNVDAVRAATRALHETDLADLLEALPQEQHIHLIEALGENFDFCVLTKLDECERKAILQQMSFERVANGVQDLENDDAVFILEDLDDPAQQQILAQISATDREILSRALNYPEESSGRYMQTDFIAITPYWLVGQAIDYMRAAENLPEDFYEILVVDPRHRPIGKVALDKILRAQPNVSISKIMERNTVIIPAEQDQEEASRLFERYDLLSAPVVDENDRLIGVLTIDDMVDVIAEAAEEDIKRLAGLGNEELSGSVAHTSYSRFPWLFVNLLTAILASLVIGLFDTTIEQMVALAVLMPIVASMGGNAGTQTMTVVVRAIATHDIDDFNAWRLIRREFMVGLSNGLVFAIIIAIATAIWFENHALATVIAIAMIINMLAAALAGILIPLGLNKLNFDPAIASTAFVTTVTDIVGFIAFLGLAAWWFQLA